MLHLFYFLPFKQMKILYETPLGFQDFAERLNLSGDCIEQQNLTGSMSDYSSQLIVVQLRGVRWCFSSFVLCIVISPFAPIPRTYTCDSGLKLVQDISESGLATFNNDLINRHQTSCSSFFCHKSTLSPRHYLIDHLSSYIIAVQSICK